MFYSLFTISWQIVRSCYHSLAIKFHICTISPRYNSFCLKILTDEKIFANGCSETEDWWSQVHSSLLCEYTQWSFLGNRKFSHYCFYLVMGYFVTFRYRLASDYYCKVIVTFYSLLDYIYVYDYQMYLWLISPVLGSIWFGLLIHFHLPLISVNLQIRYQ